jgi:hypothetical protein
VRTGAFDPKLIKLMTSPYTVWSEEMAYALTEYSFPVSKLLSKIAVISPTPDLLPSEIFSAEPSVGLLDSDIKKP